MKNTIKIKTLALALTLTVTARIANAQEKVSSTGSYVGKGLSPQERTIISNDSIQRSLSTFKKELELLKKLRISGYIQAQYQLADSSGQNSYDGGSFATNVDRRFMIRRGRVKFTYNNNIAEYIMQVNITERGINAAEITAKITDPWTKWFGVKVGLFDRPFSFDVQQSSAERETPERSRYMQILLQNDRDMGAAMIIEAPKKSKYYGFKFIGGFFNGTGIPSNGDYNNPTKPFYNDFDSFKDFIGRVSYAKSIKKDRIKYGVGVSHYYGAVRQYNNIVYSEIKPNENGAITWIASDTSVYQLKGKPAGRIFYGADFQLSTKSALGTTTIRGDFMCGQQPGTSSSSASQAFEIKTATYIRHFKGYSAVFVQRLGKSKHEIAARYAVYDPNTAVAGDQIGIKGTNLNATDISYTELGMGYNFYMTDNFKLMVYYNTVKNETSKNLNGYSKDQHDNVITLRVQVRF